MEYAHEVIFCIVHAGFSETVMDAARKHGARGGTIMRGRGTANAQIERMFGVAVTPEKEIVMILVNSSIRNDILHEIYRTAGLNTPGQGIAFALPVDGTAGVSKSESFD